MLQEEFEQLVHAALTELPEEFKQALDNIAIVIEDEPTDLQRQRGSVPYYMELYGLYEGVPKTQRANVLVKLPDKITIFKNPIERTHLSPETIKEQVRSTVLHEIGHYFGLSEERLRKLQQR